jgi:hypothetical protein
MVAPAVGAGLCRLLSARLAVRGAEKALGHWLWGRPPRSRSWALQPSGVDYHMILAANTGSLPKPKAARGKTALLARTRVASSRDLRARAYKGDHR